MLDITQIPAPRIPLMDERTGLLSRQWYRFFYNLYVLTGGGTNAVTLDELQIGPPNQPDFTEILKEVNNNISPEYQDQSGNFLATFDAAQLMAMMARFENLEAAIQGAYLQPPPTIGTVTAVTGTAPVVSSGGTAPAISMPVATSSVNGYLSSTDWATFNAKQPVAAPVTQTANFTVAATDVWLINNKPSASCTVTLPTASSYSGRVLHIQNYQVQTVISASSNVVPQAGGAAGTAILAASAGDSATLVSDGTNWLMTQYSSFNNLLLE